MRVAGARAAHVLAARRAGAPRQAAARAWRRRWRPGREHLRAHARQRDRPARGAARPRGRGARALGRARDGGLHRRRCRACGRALAPINSSMIVTEPLARSAWAEIGWEGREVIGDGAHVFVYLQRTADGRIAIGGRGVPYRFGSRTDGRGATAPRDDREPAREAAPRCSRRPRRCADRARLVGRARRAARLVRVGRRRRRHGPRLGRRLRRRGRRPPSNLAARMLRDLILGERTRAHRPAVGRPPPAPLGARAAALGCDPWRIRPLPAAPTRSSSGADGPSRLGRARGRRLGAGVNANVRASRHRNEPRRSAVRGWRRTATRSTGYGLRGLTEAPRSIQRFRTTRRRHRCDQSS